MPTIVLKSPTNGAVEPIVASAHSPRFISASTFLIFSSAAANAPAVAHLNERMSDCRSVRLWSAKIPCSGFQRSLALLTLHSEALLGRLDLTFLNVADFKDVRAG